MDHIYNDRDNYTWTMAAKDLALSSRLTLVESGAICRELEGLVHPYDILPPLISIVNGAQGQGGLFGKHLARLLRAKEDL